MHSAIKCAELISSERCVLARGSRLIVEARTALGGSTIVPQQKDQRVLAHSVPIERTQDLTYRIVSGRQHGRIHLALSRKIGKPLDILPWRMYRIMYGIQGSVQKKRLIALL